MPTQFETLKADYDTTKRALATKVLKDARIVETTLGNRVSGVTVKAINEEGFSDLQKAVGIVVSGFDGGRHDTPICEWTMRVNNAPHNSIILGPTDPSKDQVKFNEFKDKLFAEVGMSSPVMMR
jgi:hypothetical protein